MVAPFTASKIFYLGGIEPAFACRASRSLKLNYSAGLEAAGDEGEEGLLLLPPLPFAAATYFGLADGFAFSPFSAPAVAFFGAGAFLPFLPLAPPLPDMPF